MASVRGVAVEGTWLVTSGTADDTVEWTVDIESPADTGQRPECDSFVTTDYQTGIHRKVR